MKQKVHKFKCGKCDTGIVTVAVRPNKDNTTTYTTKCCNNKKCREWYGLKGVLKLEEIVEDAQPVE